MERCDAAGRGRPPELGRPQGGRRERRAAALLDGQRADRREIVRATLAEIGVVMHDGYSATELRPDGEQRYDWHRLDRDDDQQSYIAIIAQSLAQRQRWRTDYERAKQAVTANSATTHDPATSAA